MNRGFLLLSLAAVLTCAAPKAEAAGCGNGVVNSSEQCDDGNTSTAVDGCTSDCRIYPGYRCSGSPSACTLIPITGCGNGVVLAPEECDDGNATSGDGCQSDCTVQSGFVCSGSPSVCAPGSPVADCGDGDLDTGEECDDGDQDDGDGCLGDCTVQDGFVCSGEPSFCTASLDVCGDDIVGESEDCEGGDCCNDDCTFASSTTLCRSSTGGCDPEERCTGNSATCPADVMSPSATVCRPAVAEACDVEEVCTGLSADCPEDALVGCPDVDGLDCLLPACDESGECTVRDACVEICRGPQFWATRGTRGSDPQPAIGAVLDEVGSLEVCGQTIDSSNGLGDLDSALEALCVRTQGTEERALYRALVATALNCAVSDGGTCDEILDRFVDVSFTDCNALCRGDTVPGGPSIDECIDQLECFNEGGQLIEGGCATGTCEDDPEELCGGDFGECEDDEANGAGLVAAFNGNTESRGRGHGGGPGTGGNDVGGEDDLEDDDCRAFEDNCGDARLCNTDGDADAEVCLGRLRPMQQRECRDARKNQCTIDSCDD